MIHLRNVSKSFGARELLRDISWSVRKGERAGLVGENGAGKTTLLRVLAKADEPDSGHVQNRAGLSVGYLRQEGEEGMTGALLDAVLMGRPDILKLEDEIHRLGGEIGHASPERAHALSEKLGEAQESLKAAGGYSVRAEAKAILKGMGFSEEDFSKDIAAFSGGWRTRAYLCRLLLQSPDVLLLDEPTNHLDLQSTVWLEIFLKNYDGALVIISHDRYFLNRMVTSIAELEGGSLTVYPFAYDGYLAEKQARADAQEKARAQQAREIAKQEKFIERFRAKNTKATQVQSRIKALEKIERIETRSVSKTVGFTFIEAGRSGREIVKLSGVVQGYGDKIIYDGLDFIMRRGDRVALVGPNGAGKSTLMKILAGKAPIRAGEFSLGQNVVLKYFAQHQLEDLDPDKTVLEEVTGAIPYDSIPMARTCLGAFLFNGDDVSKPIKVLSGGEKSRVALAKLALTPTNLLLLDEPTNHLDLKSRVALEKALSGYSRCLLMISHDRAFIDAVANKIVHVEQGRLTEYHGNYAYYESKHTQAESASQTGATETESCVSRNSKKEARREAARNREVLSSKIRPMTDRLESVEKEIGETESLISRLENELADPAVYSVQDKARDFARRLAEARSRNEWLLEEWENISVEIEAIKSGVPS